MCIASRNQLKSERIWATDLAHNDTHNICSGPSGTAMLILPWPEWPTNFTQRSLRFVTNKQAMFGNIWRVRLLPDSESALCCSQLGYSLSVWSARSRLVLLSRSGRVGAWTGCRNGKLWKITGHGDLNNFKTDNVKNIQGANTAASTPQEI